MKEKARLYRCIALMMPVLLSACAGTWYVDPVRTSDVREYRYIPEYGGYFPIVHDKHFKRNEVKGSWLCPDEDSSKHDKCALPQTSEDAARLIRERARAERLSAAGRTSLSCVLLPITLPLFVIGEPLEHCFFIGQRARTRDESLKQFAGFEVDVSVTDLQGKPLPGAMLVEYDSLRGFNCCTYSYVDETGRRTFQPATRHPYSPGVKFYDMVAKQLPPRVDKIRNNSDAGEGFGLYSYSDKWHLADSEGRIRYTNLAFGGFADFRDSEWHWKGAVPDADLFLIIWAKGYRPIVQAVHDVRPHKNTKLQVKLSSTSEGESSGPSIEQLAPNPWKFVKELTAWGESFTKLCYSKSDRPAALTPLAAEARRLLQVGEQIDPLDPSLESLRAVVAVANGDRQKGLAASRYIDHCKFFVLFYPEI